MSDLKKAIKKAGLGPAKTTPGGQLQPLCSTGNCDPGCTTACLSGCSGSCQTNSSSGGGVLEQQTS
jgi:hypothetical protein